MLAMVMALMSCAAPATSYEGKTVQQWLAVIEAHESAPAERLAAIEAVGHFEAEAAPAAPALAKILCVGGTGNQSVAAGQALLRIGPPAVPALIDAFNGGCSAGEGEFVLEFLTASGSGLEKVVLGVLKQLDAPKADWQVYEGFFSRLGSTRVLADWAAENPALRATRTAKALHLLALVKDEKAEEYIVRMLSDPDVLVCEAASDALAQRAHHLANGLNRMLALLGSKDAKVRRWAVRAAVYRRSDVRSALEPIAKDPAPEVRLELVHSILASGSWSSDDGRLLERMCADSDERVRFALRANVSRRMDSGPLCSP